MRLSGVAKGLSLVLLVACAALLAFNALSFKGMGNGQLPGRVELPLAVRRSDSIIGSHDRVVDTIVGDASITVTLLLPGSQPVRLRLTPSASEAAVKEAVAAATGLAVGSFALKDSAGVFVTPAGRMLLADEQYHIVKVPQPPPPAAPVVANTAVAAAAAECQCPVVGAAGGAALSAVSRASDKRIVFAPDMLPVAPPRVVIAALGTGEYRQGALDALLSAVKYFGGDCVPSFHLLSDDIANVDAKFNAHVTEYREWPDSGLLKFSDIKAALYDVIKGADYFFFLDADVRFNERVNLVDVGGDLVGVEHPMYPRFYYGMCNPQDPNTGGWCIYPYQRDPRSNAYIPEFFGRFVKERKYLVTNGWYLQSAFWGGKSKFVIDVLDELIPRINEDRENKRYSSIIQDELYLNWYFWKHSNDTDKNIRMLSHSYLYPFKTDPFGFWLKEHHRPIIIHGVKRAGKLIKDQVEVKCTGTNQCVDLFSAGVHKLGLYACHKVGDSQGFIWNGSVIRTSASGIKKCFDGTDIPAGRPIVLMECTEQRPGQVWRHDNATGLVVNAASNLCLDTLRNPLLHPTPGKEIGVEQCDRNSKFQRWAFNKMSA